MVDRKGKELRWVKGVRHKKVGKQRSRSQTYKRKPKSQVSSRNRLSDKDDTWVDNHLRKELKSQDLKGELSKKSIL